MVKIGANAPLTISKEAQSVIESTRLAHNKKKSDFLRIVAAKNPASPSIAFNMFFDDAPTSADMAYKVADMKLLLDNNTAYLLVGSELILLPSGELKFEHLDTTTCFDKQDNPIMN